MSEQHADMNLIPDVCPTVYGWLTRQHEAALFLSVRPAVVSEGRSNFQS